MREPRNRNGAGSKYHQHPVRQESLGRRAVAVTMFVNHVDSANQKQPKWAGEGGGKDRLDGIHHQSELRARFADSVSRDLPHGDPQEHIWPKKHKEDWRD